MENGKILAEYFLENLQRKDSCEDMQETSVVGIELTPQGFPFEYLTLCAVFFTFL
jgi:hypothetical protein